eukprot:gene29257-12500_t
MLSTGMRVQLTDYAEWCTAPMNFDSKSQAVKGAISETEEQLMLAFLGFCVHHRATDIEDVGLVKYMNPHALADFLSFLVAREVGRDHAGRHIAVAKK